MLTKSNYKQGEFFCENCKRVVNEDSHIMRENKLAKGEEGREILIDTYSKVAVCPECCKKQVEKTLDNTPFL